MRRSRLSLNCGERQDQYGRAFERHAEHVERARRLFRLLPCRIATASPIANGILVIDLLREARDCVYPVVPAGRRQSCSRCLESAIAKAHTRKPFRLLWRGCCNVHQCMVRSLVHRRWNTSKKTLRPPGLRSQCRRVPQALGSETAKSESTGRILVEMRSALRDVFVSLYTFASWSALRSRTRHSRKRPLRKSRRA